MIFRRPRIGLLVCLLVIVAACGHSPKRQNIACPSSALERWPIPASWLIEQTEATQVELAHMQQGVPFGRLNNEWEELLEAQHAGDQLWSYDSRSNWGMAGYVLVRDCEIIYHLVTVLYE